MPQGRQFRLDGDQLLFDGRARQGREIFHRLRLGRFSSFLAGGMRTLARILASAPMMPTPANMTNVAVMRPPSVTG